MNDKNHDRKQRTPVRSFNKISKVEIARVCLAYARWPCRHCFTTALVGQESTGRWRDRGSQQCHDQPKAAWKLAVLS